MRGKETEVEREGGTERERKREGERRETRNRSEDVPLVVGDETESSFHASTDPSTRSSQCLIPTLTCTYVPSLYTPHTTVTPYPSTPNIMRIIIIMTLLWPRVVCHNIYKPKKVTFYGIREPTEPAATINRT